MPASYESTTWSAEVNGGTGVAGMSQSLLATKGLLSEDDVDDWSAAMVDALLVDAIYEAHAAGKDPKEFVFHRMQMIQERAADLMSCLPPPEAV